MPCDRIQLSQINFSIEVTDRDLLRKSMKTMGYSHIPDPNRERYRNSRGETAELLGSSMQVNTYSPSSFDMDKLKREYSTEVLKDTCERFGWRLESNEQDEYEIGKNS